MKYTNNPGNIRYNPDLRGCNGNVNGFCSFDTLANGTRGIFTLINTYRTRYNLNTISGIITRYAPPSENNTAAYIRNVSSWTGIPADRPVTDPEIKKVVAAIVKQENGLIWTADYVEQLYLSTLSPGTGSFDDAGKYLPFIALAVAAYFLLK
jgi:hypothetical protein